MAMFLVDPQETLRKNIYFWFHFLVYLSSLSADEDEAVLDVEFSTSDPGNIVLSSY